MDHGHAWITGASSGIGWHLCKQLVDAGWSVAATARREAKLTALAEACRPGRVEVCPADVTDAAQVAAAYAHATQALGPVDLCFLNAGAYEPTAIKDFQIAQFRELVETNLMGVVHCLGAVLPDMLARGGGRIVINASVAGYRGLPRGVPYGPTKAALINLAETLRAELGASGIEVQVVNPGFVKTPLTEKNRFHMPALIAPEAAAARIARGLEGRSFEITFPKRLTYVLKALRCLPYWLYFPLVRRLTDE